MKNIYLILILFTTKIFSQNFDCNVIDKNIKTLNVYDTLSNGKLIARYDRLFLENSKVYKVSLGNKYVVYVNKSNIRKIRKNIKKYHCKNILIENIKQTYINGKKSIKL